MKKTLTLMLALMLLPCLKGITQNEQSATTLNSCFVENVGQVTDLEGHAAKEVLYKLEQPGVNIYITTSGITYVFLKAIEEEDDEIELHANDLHGEAGKKEKHLFAYERFDIALTGASLKTAQVIQAEKTPHYYNFYKGTTGCAVNGVYGYNRLTFQNVYPGIDWVLYTGKKGSGLKYDFIVHPGADADRIRMLYRGKNPLALTDAGAITVQTALGSLADHIPLAYAGKPADKVDVNYHLFETRQKQEKECTWYETSFGFEVGKYRAGADLVIDPAQLFWGTYFGGNGICRIHALKPDHYGNLFTSGETSIMGIPVIDPGSNAYYQDTIEGQAELYIGRFDQSRALQWCTYYGGNGLETVNGMEITPGNAVLFCGYTTSSSLIMADPGGGAFFQPVNQGGNEGYILRFSDQGVLEWSTFFGTPGIERILDVEIGPAGEIYMAGYGSNAGLPLTGPVGSYQQSPAGSTETIIMRFTPAGVLDWFTYFGGNLMDEGYGIEVDNNGYVYVGGSTFSISLPVQSAPYPNDFYSPSHNGGNTDYFIIRFTPQLVPDWCTYLGGNGTESKPNLIVDHSNRLYVDGQSTSTNFPMVNPGGNAFYSVAGISNQFLVCFSDSLELEWSTELDNFSSNVVNAGRHAMAIGNCNELFIGAMSNSSSSNNPSMLLNPGNGAYFLSNQPATVDIMMAEFNRDHELTWGTYFGGYGTDDAVVFAVDPSGKLIIGGDGGGLAYANSSQIATFQNNCHLNPGNGAYYQPLPLVNNADYSFVAEFNLLGGMPAPVVSSVNPGCPNYNNGSVSVVAPGGSTILWQPSGSTSFNLGGLQSGVYNYTLTDSSGCTFSGYVELVPAELYDINVVAADVFLCEGESTTITAAGVPSATWSPAVGTGNTVTVTPAVTTTYIATYTDSTGCPNIDSVTVYVTPVPVAQISCPDTVCAGDLLQVAASGGFSDTWLGAPNAANPFTWLAVNDTTFTVTVTNGSGCPPDTATVSVVVIDCKIGMGEHPNLAFAVWPNPAATLINLELPDNELWRVDVFDAQGKRIVNTNLRGPKAQLPCAGWSDGNYLVRISKGEQMHHVKLVKAGK